MNRRNAWLLAAAVTFTMAGPALAAPVASDGFESYATGALAGNTGGTGWGGAWGVNATYATPTVVTGGLSYTNGSVTVNGGNRSVLFSYTNESSSVTDGLLSRALSSSQTGTVYMSLLFRDVSPNADLSNDFVQWGFDTSGATSNPKASVMRRNGSFQVRANTATTNTTDSGISTVPGTTFMLVLKATRSGSTYDSVSLFVNPASHVEPGTTDATRNANTSISSFDNFVSRSAFHEDADSFQIDAITIGTTFEDVVPVPEPSSLALLGLGGFLIARRRR